MTWIDASGYLASSLVLVTFCMRTMLTLRAVAICSNVAFIVYGIGADVYPVLVLHLILFPLNLAHFGRMIAVLRRAKFATDTDLSPNWLQPFMRERHVKAGETIFEKGDHADSLYLIASGQVELPELRKILLPGEVFGEVGLFAVDRRRTQSARALSDLELLWMRADELKKLCERNPGLSLFFLRLVATRLVSNASSTGDRDESDRTPHRDRPRHTAHDRVLFRRFLKAQSRSPCSNG
ncbi:cyclic nucleotide-binding domain-containing protein [Bradyrhizobium sp. 180]|uniref:cyclic nucleotide-binding domain-containing protein n=1 Tax=Bradyrhizobium sp. 180 TaxID=2782650 RepID=UPI001FFA0C2E|nr:cyclic nucleotide-binding domain-containing protein [Bradyrhizobium sp. 180]MCK1494935.1 cyclic nucleotide-binding domain-containing protein [Bradyrhizobium sp. 180]